jgi:hypothetical protein
MILRNAEIRPGFVLKVVDDYGTVKASVTGMFSDEADPETLPPIYPFMSLSRGTFSHPKENDPIWVLFTFDNPQELMYIRQANLPEQLSDTLDKSYEDVEVLMRTESGTGYAQVLFDTEEGLVVQNDDSSMVINKDGNITISKNGSHRTIEINSDGISLGSEGKSAEPALLGDKTEDALNKLWNCVNTIVLALQSTCPYAAPAMAQVQAQGVLPQAKSAIMKIKSKHVTLD